MNTNNQKLSGRVVQSPLPFALSLIAVVAFRMAGSRWHNAKTQVLWIVVLLAVLALSPVGVSASVKCSGTHLDEEMVGVILTDQQVLGPVVTSDVIPVVNFFGGLQMASESSFNHEDVLIDVPAFTQSWVFAHSFLSIPVCVCNSASPVRGSFTPPTNTRRINQSRAPKVCAESTTNLTHSGGTRG